MREVVGQNSTTYWILTDHLGSQSITANADGSFHSEVRYTAFGETRYTSAADTPTDYLYTGQRLEEEAGLYYYNARFYDAALAHFIQADMVVSNQWNLLSYDRYAYTNDNPLIYTDPDGHCPLWVTAVIGGAIGAIVGAVGYTAYTAISGKQFDTGTMLLAAGGGLVAGALIGTGIGWAAGVGAAEATTAAVTGAGVVETANTACGGDMCVSEIQDTTQTVQSAIPAAENAVGEAVTSVNTGTNVVYQYIENGIVKYYGITNDFARRASEHLSSREWTINAIDGLQNLSRYDARAVEQVLIEQTGLSNLYNKINSIAQTNPIYEEAIRRGLGILDTIKFVER